jgi:hypothetical protein
VSRPERFSVVAPLPPHGEWRRALALDRSGADAQAVVLAHVPHAVLDDPARLAAVVRDVEAAGRLHHPSAVPVLGTQTLEDGLVVVEAHRPGTSLRALLDAGGRLPPDVAVRIAIDACGAVGRAHVLDAGDGKKLVHGAIRPDRILVGEDGAALVTGFGTGAAAEPADDVRALAAVLHECLAGEPPGSPPSSLEEAGISSVLSAAVARGLGAAPDAPRSAAALVEAVVAAGSVASHADVAAYVDAILPPGEGARGELSRALAAALGGNAEEVSEDYIVEPTDPAVRPAEPTPEPLPRPPSTRPGADPAGVFAAPARSARRSRAPVVAALVCAALGFAAGFGAARLRPSAAPPSSSAAAAEAPRPMPTTVPQAAPAPPAAAALPTPAAKAGITTRPPTRMAATAAAKRTPKRAVKAPAKTAEKAAAKTAPDGKGVLHVAAPAEAEVFLDERPIGKGSVHLEIPEGAHRIEVRLGQNRVAESFSVAAGETWTYDVTPTPSQ